MSDGQALLDRRAGVRNVATRVVGALVGLAVAYVCARRITVEFAGGATDSLRDVALEVGLFVGIAALTLTATSAVPIRRDLLLIHRLVAESEAELRRRNRDQRFLRRVQSAFEMTDTDDELFAIAGDAMRDASDHPGEILVADSSNAHLARVATTTGHDAPGCNVATPRNCPAVRSGQTLRFPNANDLSTCPRLRERGLDDAHASVCVPVNVLGTPSAVLHAGRDSTGVSVDELEANVAALEGIAVRFGARLGMMRAISQSQLQADTDPLTGLLNRRAMENQVRAMRVDEHAFAVVMADLDHFKDLNDTFGHDTGDRALRLFSRVMRSAVRDADIVSRHGGEEFVIVLPGADVVSAAPVLHRLRERLAASLADAQLPTFTVSLGVVDSTAGDDLSELLRLADRALLCAKADGRDRIQIWDPSIRPDRALHPTSSEEPAASGGAANQA